MKAGLLRHRVTIATAAEAQDEYGQQVETYPPGSTVWAQVEQQQQSEGEAQEGVVRRRRIVVTIRQPLTVTTRSRVTFGGVDHNVVDVIDPNGDGYLWQIVAERID